MGKHNCRSGQEAVAKYARKDLTHTQYLVLLQYASYVNGDATAYPGIETLASMLRLHKNTVWQARKDLVAAGELAEVGRKGRNGPKVYRVTAVVRGLTPQGCEPMGSQETAVGSQSNGRGLTPQGVSEVVTARRSKRLEGERPPQNGNVTNLEEAIRAKGFDKHGRIGGLYLREIQELERREKERRDLELLDELNERLAQPRKAA
jgi:hypothetical protein